MKVNIGKYPKNNNSRKVKVQVEKHDTWNLDETLAHIIHPALIQLKKEQNGIPYVAPEDAPHIARVKGELDLKFDHNLEAWEYIISEMIYAMQQIKDCKPDEEQFYNTPGRANIEGLMEYNARLQNGCRLFGAYFLALWD